MTAKAIPADPFIAITQRLDDIMNRQSILLVEAFAAGPTERESIRAQWQSLNDEAESLFAEQDRLIEGETLQ